MSNKAREALEVIAEICDGKDIGGLDRIVGIYNIAKAALAEPPRNCEIGTADEQVERLLKFCEMQICCDKCPYNKEGDISAKCFARWAQTPYEETKGSSE